MNHQDWSSVVIQKKKPEKAHVVSNTSVSKPIIPPTEVLDMSEKKIEYFTVDMGRKIASLRALKSWTQDELAQRMCIPKKTIADLERGNEKYNGPLVSKLKRVLGNFTW